MMGNRSTKFKFVNVSSYTIMTHKVINQKDVQITPLIVTSYDHFDWYVFLTLTYCYSVGKIVNFYNQTIKFGVLSVMRRIFV